MKLRHMLAGASLALAATGCGTSDSSSDELVNASISLAPISAASAASSAYGMAALMMGGPVDPSVIDSLMVTVIRVDVLPDSILARCHPPEGDSARGFRPGRPPEGVPGGPIDALPEFCRKRGNGPFGPGGPGGPMGPRDHPPRPDSLVPPDTGWGSRPNHWYSLRVVGSGHIDLLHLPANGLTLASGSLPAGEYGHARLIINEAVIWFNQRVVSNDSSVTLEPNVGYPVSLPHRRGGIMGIMTNAGFTLPEGGGDVQLLFDPAATIGNVIVVDSGKVVMRPVLKPRG